MPNMGQRKIMVALDGSGQSLDAVRYVTTILNPQNTEVVLFHVMTKIPDSFWDMERSSSYQYKIANLGAWEKQQEKVIDEFMGKAVRILNDANFLNESIDIKVQERKEGIARDIMSESRKGYDAIVVGRKGLSRLKDLVIGSVADKLIGKLTHAPVWLVGEKPFPKKVLISMDASEGSMQAVNYVADMLGVGSSHEVTLFHAIRGLDVFLQGFGDAFVLDYDKEWVDRAEKELDEAEKEMEATFTEAENRLMKAGFDPHFVSHKIVKGVSSRAGTIVQEGVDGGYGTLVVGRRGLSKVQEFFMGRVSNKVIHLAKEQAVWVVS